jgi:Na+/H+ antiporter NhaD/arsenite permease-like protein
MQRQHIKVHAGAGVIRPSGSVHIPAQLSHWVQQILAFMKANTVMVVAFAAAVITSVIVPVDAAYIGYFDFKTLACLFSVLAVVCALKNIRFFYVLAQRIVRCFRNARLSVLALVYITFIGSMLIANDMALLTFLPLGYFVLSTTGKEKYMAFTFIMQNIAANLGGMLTPFGNPQNLYLYSKFNIPNLEFMSIMLLPFLLAVGLITVCCLIFVKAEPLEISGEAIKLPVGRTLAYLALFALSIAIVFRGIPYWLGLVIIPAVLMFMDRKALKAVDYPLLLTFVFFFIFAGNMARIDAVRQLLSGLLEKNTLLFSVFSCQFISNVPSAILLSQFTGNYAELLVGVNIGGTGTLIASLASLITFSEYVKHNPGKTGYYVKVFSAFNFGFLIILTGVMLLVR